MENQLLDTLSALPKIELHRHLEGSMRLDTLVEIARSHAFEMPEYDPEMLRPFVQMMPEEKRDWQHFFAKFATLRQFYLSPEIIQRITREAVIDAARDNIHYMELRFTPRTLGKIIKAEPSTVIGWVCEAAQQAAIDHAIQVRLIVSINRHESPELGHEVMTAAAAHREHGVVGLDLAGVEEGFSAQLFMPLFQQAREAGLGLTVHAGEWEGAQSVWDAVGSLGATRIGHGIRVLEDPAIMQMLAERRIVLEVCPTSNYYTGVIDALEDHPLPKLNASGLLTTINTDDPLIFNLTLTQELTVAVEHLGLTLDEIKQGMVRAAEAAFLPDEARHALVERVRGLLGLPTISL